MRTVIKTSVGRQNAWSAACNSLAKFDTFRNPLVQGSKLHKAVGAVTLRNQVRIMTKAQHQHWRIVSESFQLLSYHTPTNTGPRGA